MLSRDAVNIALQNSIPDDKTLNQNVSCQIKELPRGTNISNTSRRPNYEMSSPNYESLSHPRLMVTQIVKQRLEPVTIRLDKFEGKFEHFQQHIMDLLSHRLPPSDQADEPNSHSKGDNSDWDQEDELLSDHNLYNDTWEPTDIEGTLKASTQDISDLDLITVEQEPGLACLIHSVFF